MRARYVRACGHYPNAKRRRGSADLVADTFKKVSTVISALPFLNTRPRGGVTGAEPPSNKMPCYHPIDAWKPADGGRLVFSEIAERGNARPLQIPCGRCVGCRLERSRQWAVRCLHEASLFDSNQFLTLTYDNDHLPDGGSLQYKDFQLFAKRVRYKLGPFRFYMCGEYGETTWRPHYHACMFGLSLPDKKPLTEELYESKTIESLWGLGRVVVGNVTFESAAYVARYVMKKITGDAAETHYRRVNTETGEVWQLEPEFNKMSLRPAIGREWYNKYSSDVRNHDTVVVRGQKCKPPRYYDKILADGDPDAAAYLKFERELKAAATLEHATPARLAVREKVTKAALALKSRDLQ